LNYLFKENSSKTL